jgi:hypothetical protein
MADDLKLEDQYIKGYETINGEQIPIIHCPTKITIKNKVTGEIYNSEAEANADVANPNTSTKAEDISKDVQITVAHLSYLVKPNNATKRRNRITTRISYQTR